MNDGTDGAALGAEARWETGSAPRYMAQLCKHFAHKLPVTLNERDGQIVFAAGTCDLVAEREALRMRVLAADEAGLEQLQGVVVRHLQRFAFRDLSEEEAAAISWVPV
ncbi:MAG: DUF2218 domain-containing protein [Proteobacteria bacterium]|nr:DUF2218 domain-containing protein [Pseudomonadota bacterium]